ncbi:uncharacterized protein LOC125069531 [Vanessa atalanta]|uniref:uncharacterized protein LOC125069531 n=1 Tax=Vanessa atalanta TaxID=42275 RepID=UPI001FCD8605|nr:uncharacterized protein LOC125069531 [Vanessa atalanta]
MYVQTTASGNVLIDRDGRNIAQEGAAGCPSRLQSAACARAPRTLHAAPLRALVAHPHPHPPLHTCTPPSVTTTTWTDLLHLCLRCHRLRIPELYAMLLRVVHSYPRLRLLQELITIFLANEK